MCRLCSGTETSYSVPKFLGLATSSRSKFYYAGVQVLQSKFRDSGFGLPLSLRTKRIYQDRGGSVRKFRAINSYFVQDKSTLMPKKNKAVAFKFNIIKMQYFLTPALVLLLPIVQAQQTLYGQCITSTLLSSVQV